MLIKDYLSRHLMPSIAGQVDIFFCSLWAQSPLGSIYFFIHTTQKNVSIVLAVTSVQSAAESHGECKCCKWEQPFITCSLDENLSVGNWQPHLLKLCLKLQQTTNQNKQINQRRKCRTVVLSWNNSKNVEYQKILYLYGILILCKH